MHVMMHEKHLVCSCWGFLDVHVGMRMFFLYLTKLPVLEGGLCMGMLMIDMNLVLVGVLCMYKEHNNFKL